MQIKHKRLHIHFIIKYGTRLSRPQVNSGWPQICNGGRYQMVEFKVITSSVIICETYFFRDLFSPLTTNPNLLTCLATTCRKTMLRLNNNDVPITIYDLLLHFSVTALAQQQHDDVALTTQLIMRINDLSVCQHLNTIFKRIDNHTANYTATYCYFHLFRCNNCYM